MKINLNVGILWFTSFLLSFLPLSLSLSLSLSLAPTAVISLVLNRASDNSFNVMWSRPVPANGVITHYTVSIRYYSNTTAVKTDQNTTNTYLSIDQLRKSTTIMLDLEGVQETFGLPHLV